MVILIVILYLLLINSQKITFIIDFLAGFSYFMSEQFLNFEPSNDERSMHVRTEIKKTV